MGLFKDCGCGCNGKKQEQRLMNSILAGLVFFMIASPDTFRFMRSLLGKWVSGPNGCPTTGGLFLHTLVFILITWGMMNIKKEGGCPKTKKGCGCGGAKKKGTKKVVVPMVDAPEPKPGFAEPEIKLEDTGRILEPMSTSADGNLF